MIIPLELPPKIVLSGNPVVARLASNNFVTNEGTAAVFVFRFSANEANGRTFIFSSELAGTFTFTFRTAPDGNSPTDLRLKGALSDAAWIAQLRAIFESNYYLEQYYFITEAVVGGNPVIRFVARQPGTASTIEVEECTVENLVEVENTAGTNRTTRPNFRVLVETYMKGLVNFRRKGVGDLISVDGQGVGISQINAYLEDRLENQFAWPIQGLTPVGFRNHLASRTYLRFGESYGIPEQVYKLFKSPEFVTLQGRIPRKRLPDFFRTYNDLQDFFIKEKRFLTWQPLVKETFIDAPEKLFWLHFYENVDQAKIRVKRVLQDGTSTTIDFTSMFATPVFSVLEIDASAGILAPGISDIAELHVWLAKGDNSPISVTQKYLIKPRPADVHYYLFENAWGAYDTTAFTGELIEEDDYKRELEERYKPSLFTQPQRRFRNLRVDQLEKFTVHSGFSSDKDWLLWLDDLFTSPAVFEAIGKVLHEVTIEDAEVFKSRSKQFVRSLSFTYLRQSPEQVYRIAPPSVLLGDPAIDPDAPVPQFGAQLMIGDSGLDELYFPGNAWINIPNEMVPTNSFTLTTVLYLLDGNVVLFSDDNLVIAIDATGTKLILIELGEENFEHELDLGQDLRRKQFLLQVQIDAGQLSAYVNGVLAGTTEGEVTAVFSPSNFGKKFGDFGNFKGRLGDYHFGSVDDLNNFDVFMAMAERFGLPVPGVNWMLEYDEETREYIFENGLTRTGAISGFVQLGRAEMPGFDIAPGAYVGPYPVKLVSNNLGGVLHFTVDGSEPTTLSPVFNPLTDVIEVNSLMSIKMIEVVENLLPSQVVTGIFTLPKVATPVLNPSGGFFASPKTVHGDSVTPGSVTRYTLNGDIPNESSTILTVSGVVLTALPETEEEITMKVISYASGYLPSDMVTADFIINNIKTDDPDVQAFMEAGDYDDNAFLSAFAELVYQLKLNELWDKIKLAQVFYGTTAAQHGLNIKDPRDLDEAFRLAFQNSWSFSNNGALGLATGAYARTFLNQATQFSAEDGISLGVFTSGLQSQFSQGHGSGNFRLRTRRDQGDVSYTVPNGNEANILGYQGFLGHSLKKDASLSAWNRIRTNGTTATSNVTGSTTLPSLELFIGSANVNGTPNDQQCNTLQFCFIGSYMTVGELQTLRSIVVDFNTAVR
jgi:hypothetical protein